jgi:RNA polymerase sigma factor (sigma-70 family)
MSHRGLGQFIRCLQSSLEPPDGGYLCDRDLFERWLTKRDPAAFETLVWRHGTMVLNTCRRLLRDEQDVEDAFQATYLLFLRKAGTIRTGDRVAGWLHRVAWRVALRARSTPRSCPQIELPAEIDRSASPEDHLLWNELRQVIDEEVNRLAERERLPFVLCYLEGRTNEEAAREMSCPVGTVESRLARARRQLRTRLSRRGLAPTAVPLSILPAIPDAVSTISDGLVRRVVQLSDAPDPSPRVAMLAKVVSRALIVGKLSAAAIAIAVASLVGAGTAFALYQGQADETQTVASAAPLPSKREQPPLAISTTTLFDRLLEAMDRIDKKSVNQIRMIERVAVLQARDADTKGARSSLERAEAMISDLFARQDATYEWRELAKAQAEAGELNAALATADRIVGDMKKYTVQEMASALARVGNFDAARRVADKVGDDDQRDVAFMDIAKEMAVAGDIKGALLLTRSIKSPTLRVLSLLGNDSQMGGICLLQMKAGDRAGARETARQGIALAGEVAPGKGGGRVWVWAARAQARLGEFAEAEKCAAKAPIDEVLPYVGLAHLRDEAVREISFAAAEAGRFDDAIKAASTIRTLSYRLAALNAIAVAHARAGQRAASREAFAGAIKLAEEAAKIEKDPQQKANLFTMLAGALAEAGNFDEAEKMMVRGGSSLVVRSNIASARACQKDFVGALKNAESLNDDQFWKANTLQYIARLQTEAGDERAVLARVDAIASPQDKAATLMGILEGRFEKAASRGRKSWKP